MTQADAFMCANCGGPVERFAAPGRTRLYRPGVEMLIPADIALPACRDCGDLYLDPEDSARVDALLHDQYQDRQRRKWGGYVERFQARHGVTQREIARVLAITPSHLSHILSAQAEPSLSLTRLAEALVACPGEFLRHLKRNEAIVFAATPRPAYAGYSGQNPAGASLWNTDSFAEAVETGATIPVRVVA